MVARIERPVICKLCNTPARIMDIYKAYGTVYLRQRCTSCDFTLTKMLFEDDLKDTDCTPRTEVASST